MHSRCLPCAACLLSQPPEPLQADNPEFCLKMTETPVCMSDKSSQTLSEKTQSELEKQEATQHVCCPQYNTVHSDSDRHRSPACRATCSFQTVRTVIVVKREENKGKGALFLMLFLEITENTD